MSLGSWAEYRLWIRSGKVGKKSEQRKIFKKKTRKNTFFCLLYYTTLTSVFVLVLPGLSSSKDGGRNWLCENMNIHQVAKVPVT